VHGGDDYIVDIAEPIPSVNTSLTLVMAYTSLAAFDPSNCRNPNNPYSHCAEEVRTPKAHLDHNDVPADVSRKRPW
jgi:hypothetical protein